MTSNSFTEGLIEWIECDKPIAQFIFSHGAGAGSDSEFMQDMALRLAQEGIQVGLFDFEYMQKAKAEQKKRPPERAPKLLAYFNRVLEQANPNLPLFIGGKSMGGRMSSMIACESNFPIQGVIVFGYPFHPPGKSEKLRIEHFPDLTCPFVVMQGERDTFGSKAGLAAMDIPHMPKVVWLNDGDHSLKPRKASGLTESDNRTQAIRSTVNFIKEQLA